MGLPVMNAEELKFNADWFTNNIKNWDKYLSHLKGGKYISALEVGSWEGMSACWTLQNILTGEGSTLTCIDTFQGNPENGKLGYENSVRANFLSNISAIGCADKVTLIETPSQQSLKFLHEKSFDFIYIDGSHVTTDVLTDLVLSWRLLKNGGIMILDDYRYCVPEMDCVPALAIESFKTIFNRELIELHKDYQVIWRKI